MIKDAKNHQKKINGISKTMKFVLSSFTKKLNNGVPYDSKMKKYVTIINSMKGKIQIF